MSSGTADAAPARLDIDSTGEHTALILSGRWTGDAAREIERAIHQLDRRLSDTKDLRFDLAAIEDLDTVGAWLIVGAQNAAAATGRKIEITGGTPAQLALLRRVASTRLAPGITPAKGLPFLIRPFDMLGRAVAEAVTDTVRLATAFGEMLAVLVTSFSGRGHFRLTAFVNQFDLIVFRAVPIVMLISLVVGAIITQQTILQLRNFGVSIYVVDLAAILMLREVGLLLAAIMVAGRSGSAITAEIGSMRMREELDALSVMGVDPYRALVLPRMMALIVGMPLLAFLASLAGLAGAAIVARVYGEIPLEVFLDRLRDALSMRSLMVGMIKAPAMAFIIGLVAINEGFKVKGSAESLGRRTTASVVRAIFLVIVADGLFAVFFAAIGF
ncbi:ABC transporter permease [Pelagibacterium limicola]|uniref:ABC transporter permease n=1 Tax=Pelagibacterium limicola TaxID=2791022 RepID=UPI0018AFAB84|nr:ABC transporter permease [Pelagibacterium limicola]